MTSSKKISQSVQRKQPFSASVFSIDQIITFVFPVKRTGKLKADMVRVTEGWSDFSCIGIPAITVTLIEDVVISSVTFYILIKPGSVFVRLQ